MRGRADKARTRHSLAAGARDMLPILVGVLPFGLVAGATVVQAGMGVLEAVGMSLFVNAGASQIVATSLFAEHAPLLVVLGTALIVNARMFIYSTSIAPVLSEASPALRPVLGHMLVDQNYATTMTHGRHREDVDVIPYYVGCWLALATVWQLSTLAGALAGSVIPASWGLDFALPLVFMAIVVPAIKDRVSAGVAVVTAVAAAVLVPVLPMQTGLLAALVAGMLWGAIFDRTPPAGASGGVETGEAVAEEAPSEDYL